MKISINWLDEWVEVSDLEPRELAHRLTMAGLEVDSLEEIGGGHEDIVVGEIRQIEEHPKADRLVICKVDVGEKEGERTIVCGAKNMSVGDRVPTALPGSQPPGLDFEIGRREVMGVESGGMLCSEEELELAEESEGLMIIEEDVAIGEPVFRALGLEDTILEIDLTPNRSDCLSHLGVAREVSALYDRPLREQRLNIGAIEEDGSRPAGKIADLTVIDDEGCPHYRMAILENLDVVDSPAWLKRRLLSVGVRTVNYVVDVTNYVLMDVGQPLHAFDLDRLEGPEIVVRRAEEGETMVGIDHEEYELGTDDLVICDARGPVALAGVMGGERTEVSEETKRVLLECAYFDPTSVRRASKRHGLHTESSHRFERSIDAGGVEAAMERTLEVLVRVQSEATGVAPRVCAGVEVAGGAPKELRQVELDPERASSMVGVEFDASQCRRLLESLGIEVEAADGGRLRCRVPSFRNDLDRPIDLVEELARLYGYDNIPTTLPRMAVAEKHVRRTEAKEQTIVSRHERSQIDWVRTTLLEEGLLEAISYSFMGDEDLDRLRLTDDDCRRKAARVANPLVKSQARMRTTLMASMLDSVQRNFAQSRSDVALFEIGRRYFTSGERRTVALAVTGRRRRHWSGDRLWDFFDLKGVVESMATPWDVQGASWTRPDEPEPFLHPGVQAVWKRRDGQILGFVGQLHPAVAQQEEIDDPLYLAEIDLETLIDTGSPNRLARRPAKYPAVVRDYALLYERERPYAELKEAVEELAQEDDESFGPVFETMELFDVYQGEQVPQGYRSLAIKITYRSDERTLQEADVEAADRQLLSHLEAEVGARLR